jgi:hypothetical protein
MATMGMPTAGAPQQRQQQLGQHQQAHAHQNWQQAMRPTGNGGYGGTGTGTGGGFGGGVRMSPMNAMNATTSSAFSISGLVDPISGQPTFGGPPKPSPGAADPFSSLMGRH